MKRSLSFSEVQTALSCTFRWDLAYGGRMAGSTLRRRQIAPILSDGRAWGAAVAAWHAGGSLPDAHAALRESYSADVAEQRAVGIVLAPSVHIERVERLASMLDHYAMSASRLPNLTRIEHEFDVPIRSRSALARASSRYRFTGFFDGYTIEDGGARWLVEFKLRNALQPLEQIQLSPQLRWYALALAAMDGDPVVGVIIDERWNEAPKPPRLVKSRKRGEDLTPSHAKDQLTTPTAYAAVCDEYNVSADPETVGALAQRSWQHRERIVFRPGELDQASRELVSAARLISQLDSGTLWPIRNAQPALCRSCRFLDICANPRDTLYVDILFERDVLKRDQPADGSSSRARAASRASATSLHPRGVESVSSLSRTPSADVSAGSHGSFAINPFGLAASHATETRED